MVEHELFLRQMSSIEPSPNVVNQLLSILRPFICRRGHQFYRRGSAAQYIYFIKQGQVELAAEDGAPWKFSANSVVGILDAIIGRSHTRTATAMTDVEALQLRTDDYYDLLEDNFEFCQLIISDNSTDLLHRSMTLNPRRLLRGRAEHILVAERVRPFSMVERLLVLRKVTAFLRGSTQALVGLAEQARESQWKAGEVLFREGDPSDNFWVIASGRVQIQRKEPPFEVERGPGDLVEAYAAFGSKHRAFTATATTPITVLDIHREDLFDQMEAHFELTRSVLAFLASEREKFNQLVANTPDYPTEDSPRYPAGR